MSSSDTVVQLVRELQGNQSAYAENERYLTGTQRLAFMSRAAREHTHLDRMAVNIPAIQVSAISERLRVAGVKVMAGGVESPFLTEKLASAWRVANMDQSFPALFRDALGFGSAFATVWRKPDGSVRIALESAQNALVDYAGGEPVQALTLKTVDGKTVAYHFERGQITQWRADAPGAAGGFKVVGRVANPTRMVPVVEFRNQRFIGGDPWSEMQDLKPLVDGLNKSLADMMVGSEFYARPRRYATGVELLTDPETGDAVNPYPEGDRMMIAEQSDAKFGQLEGSDLGSYGTAVNVLMGQIEAVSALPSHYLGTLTGQSPGADGLRAAEAALTARAEAKQPMFGPSVERLALLTLATSGLVSSAPESRVAWSDAATRSIAQEADAVVKLYQAGLLPVTYALGRLGYSEDEIGQIREARRAEALDALTLPQVRA